VFVCDLFSASGERYTLGLCWVALIFYHACKRACFSCITGHVTGQLMALFKPIRLYGNRTLVGVSCWIHRLRYSSCFAFSKYSFAYPSSCMLRCTCMLWGTRASASHLQCVRCWISVWKAVAAPHAVEPVILGLARYETHAVWLYTAKSAAFHVYNLYVSGQSRVLSCDNAETHEEVIRIDTANDVSTHGAATVCIIYILL
jgi:hypothetical protein